MIVNNLPPTYQSNQSTVASKSESEITTKTSGGSVQPPPNAQIAESVTYARGISGIESPILVRDLQVSENLTHISISV